MITMYEDDNDIRTREGERIAMRPPPRESAPAPGVKHDHAKRRWDLLPWDAAGLVVDVLAHGARKYSDDNWRHVPDARRRYFAAALRHIVSWYSGEYLDDESRLPHLAHAACCVLFLLSLEESDITIDTTEGEP